jgi:hypothetical protein
MDSPDAIAFIEHWWVEPVPGPGGTVILVLQSMDGAERLSVTLDLTRGAVGLRRQVEATWLDQVWIENVQRVWFDDQDGRLYGEGDALSLWIEKDPRPRFKLSLGTRWSQG